MNNETEHRVVKQLDRLEQKLDRVSDALTKHRIESERRLTRVETKSSILGTIGGVLGGFFAGWIR